MDIINSLFIIILLPISFLYVKVFSGYISDVFVGKLTKASFEIDLPSIFDMWVGYSIGMIAFIFMVLRIEFYGKFSADIDQVLFIGFFSLYIGRIITHQKGVYFGKIHFSILFILSTVFFTIACSGFLFTNLGSVASGGLYNSIDEFRLVYSNGLRHVLDFIKSIIFSYMLGPIILATFGECFLYIRRSKKIRSIVAVSEKTPSDFRTITGKEGISKKINDLFGNSSRVINLKCVTKSCTMPYDLRKLIEEEYKRMNEDILANKLMPSYKILRSPDNYVFRDYFNYLNTMQISLDRFRDKKMIMGRYRKDYYKKYSVLLDLKRRRLIEEKPYYFGQMRFLILGYENGDKKMLMIVKDKSIRKSRVGLYTEEPYIIDMFEEMFNSIWDLIK